MSRYIFRGMTKNKNWVYGAYLKHLPYTPSPDQDNNEADYKHLIVKDAFSDWNMPRQVDCFEVDPKTVGQSTGLKDYKEKEVFESDIVTPKVCENHKYRPIGVITWYDDLVSFVIKYRDGTVQRLGMMMEMEDYLVIGNIYQDSHLLEVKESE